jgi:glycosyltransferase involved in cell wall biosynthesis
VVGEFYDNPDSYFNLIEELNISERVKVINQFVANEEVAKYYLASDIVVLPYRSATQSGILNVAYGFNKPVIVTNVGGLAEFVIEGKTGFVIKPDSEDEILRGYEEYLSKNDEVNFKENIIEFNRKNSFENLPKLISQILTGN